MYLQYLETNNYAFVISTLSWESITPDKTWYVHSVTTWAAVCLPSHYRTDTLTYPERMALNQSTAVTWQRTQWRHLSICTYGKTKLCQRNVWYSQSSFTNRCTFFRTYIKIYIKIRWLLHVSVYDNQQGACNWAWLIDIKTFSIVTSLFVMRWRGSMSVINRVLFLNNNYNSVINVVQCTVQR